MYVCPSVHQSVRNAMGEMCFSAVLKDRQLKFLVKVKIPNIICASTLYIILSVCLSVSDAMGEMCFSVVLKDRQL